MSKHTDTDNAVSADSADNADNAVSATFIYSGLPDYWGGNGDRWDDNRGCLFAYLAPNMTIKDIIDGWVNDYNSGGDCEGAAWENVDADAIRSALVAMLTLDGKRDYELGDKANPSELVADMEAAPETFEEREDYDDGDAPYAIVLLSVDNDDDDSDDDSDDADVIG